VEGCYVGSTTNFTKRKSEHKWNYHNCTLSESKTKIYETIRNKDGWDNWSILETEKYPSKDNNEARIRERYWFEQLKSKLNTNRPISTSEEKQISNIKKCYDYRQLNRHALLDEKKNIGKKQG